MRPCTDCQAARETNGLWVFHCPTCVWCGARLIQRIATLPLRREALSARRKQVLADWLAMGHSEKEIRSLVAGGALPLQPAGPRGEQTKTKPP